MSFLIASTRTRRAPSVDQICRLPPRGSIAVLIDVQAALPEGSWPPAPSSPKARWFAHAGDLLAVVDLEREVGRSSTVEETYSAPVSPLEHLLLPF